MENRPLSPHIQIYKWHISSLVSISHRITGIINFFAITLICIWFALMLLGESNYQIIKNILETFLSQKILTLDALAKFFLDLEDCSMYVTCSVKSGLSNDTKIITLKSLGTIWHPYSKKNGTLTTLLCLISLFIFF